MRSIFVAFLVVFGPSTAHGNDLQTSLSLETLFQTLLSKANPDVEIRTNYLEGLLNSNYRIDSRIDDFEKELDELAKRADQDPSFSVNPLDSESYQQIMSGTRVSAQLSKQITYVYRRFLETLMDPSISQDIRDKSNAALQEIDNYLANLPDEDRIQLSDLIDELKELRNRATAPATARQCRKSAACFRIWA